MDQAEQVLAAAPTYWLLRHTKQNLFAVPSRDVVAKTRGPRYVIGSTPWQITGARGPWETQPSVPIKTDFQDNHSLLGALVLDILRLFAAKHNNGSRQ